MKISKLIVLSAALISVSFSVFAANTNPVRDVLERTTGQKLENLNLILTENPGEEDWFKVSSDNGKARVEASSLSSLAYGSYQFLRDIGALSVSWEGTRVDIPQSFPDFEQYRSVSLVDERVYLNVCAYGYSTPWWGWQRWQQEIDWMALHGVNSPVAMEGQEYVWKKLWQEFGVPDAELAEYFSGPAFAPWQRMGNIEGHEPPITDAWINKKKELQLKLLQRMRELGMKPITPAFGGYVPSYFKSRFPKANIYEMEPWSGFEKPSYWLDPKDPLFKKIAKRFIEIYTETYGESDYYLSDSFNEMLPPVSEENRYEELSAYGGYIYDSITQAAPDATWVMQGWMFGADKEFWDAKSIESFLSKVPNDRVRIHDIGNDRYAVWEGANAFFGKPWVLGYIHNYGASNPVYGNFAFYDKTFMHAFNSAGKGDLRGYGAFPEGINNNSVVYEYMFDVPWTDHHKESVSDWLGGYTRARYGKTSPALIKTWGKLEKAVYSTQYWQPRWLDGSAGAYLFFKRPQVSLAQFKGHPSQPELLREAIDELLTMQSEFKDSPLYLYDLVDLSRHYVSIRMDALLQHAIGAYQRGDIKTGDAAVKRLKQVTKKLDQLLGNQQESLATWVSDANAYGDTPKDAAAYVFNAKKQITTWGGLTLKDYASKAWQGMYWDFYWPRWQKFFALMREAAKTSSDFDEAAFTRDIKAWEDAWAEDKTLPQQRSPKKPVKLITQLLRLLDQSKG